MVERIDAEQVEAINEKCQEWIRTFLSTWTEGLANIAESVPVDWEAPEGYRRVVVRPWFTERLGSTMRYDFDILLGEVSEFGKLKLGKEIGGLTLRVNCRDSEYILDTIVGARRIVHQIPTCAGAAVLVPVK